MLTPSGHSPSYNLTMLLYQWALTLKKEGHPVIIAGIGKPTYPINLDFVETQRKYWDDISHKSKRSRSLFTPNNPNNSLISEIDATIDYGEPQGDLIYRTSIANTLEQYFKNKIPINAGNIIFTTGGSSALFNIFKIINRRQPKGFIVTSFPHYPLYSGYHDENILYPIHALNYPGYRLTSCVLKETLQHAYAEAKAQKSSLSAFILCNPNNPLGTVLNEEELTNIAEVLRDYPEMMIILDEVYAEMYFSEKNYVSLIEVAPDLKNRIILMRSGTKAFSAAGERIAIIAAFDETIIHELITENINSFTHAPRSAQAAFASALSNMSSEELSHIKAYYEPQVRYVEKRLKQMDAAMPDPDYKVEGGFYVMADLSQLLGMNIPASASRALNRTGKAKTDYDIAFSLLFEHQIMIIPLSNPGTSQHQGYFRITCSAGLSILQEMMDRIECVLTKSATSRVPSLQVPNIM